MSEMSERKVLEEEQEKEEAGGTSKVKTPHKDVGNKENVPQKKKIPKK